MPIVVVSAVRSAVSAGIEAVPRAVAGGTGSTTSLILQPCWAGSPAMRACKKEMTEGTPRISREACSLGPLRRVRANASGGHGHVDLVDERLDVVLVAPAVDEGRRISNGDDWAASARRGPSMDGLSSVFESGRCQRMRALPSSVRYR